MVRISGIPTLPPIPEDEGLNLVRSTEPAPKIIYSAVTPRELRPVEPVAAPPPFFTPGRIAAICGSIIVLMFLAAGVAYWIQSRRYPVVVTISLPDKDSANDPLAGRPGPLVPVSPDLVHVTSIALGTPRLTIANGKRLEEGDWLVVNAPLGAASLRVISIQDGLVRFRHGGETIDIKLQTAAAKPLQ